MFSFDYVNLWLCLLSNWSYVFYDSAFPIFTYPFSVYFLFISSNFKLYLFLKTNEIYLFSNIEGRFLLFVFALVSHLKSLVHGECHNFVIFHPFLMPLVAMCSLSVPDHSSILPSIFINSITLNCPKYWCFISSIELIDPHTCFFMFLDWICVFLTLQSCHYILPRFSHFKQVISSMGASAIPLHIFQIWCFSEVRFNQLVLHFCILLICVFAWFKFSNHSPHVPPAFW